MQSLRAGWVASIQVSGIGVILLYLLRSALLRVFALR